MHIDNDICLIGRHVYYSCRFTLVAVRFPNAMLVTRYMNDHTSMFCGGKKLSCYGCGAEVQLKNVARHVHEECEVLKGFTKPGIDWGKASVGNREPMTNYSR